MVGVRLGVQISSVLTLGGNHRATYCRQINHSVNSTQCVRHGCVMRKVQTKDKTNTQVYHDMVTDNKKGNREWTKTPMVHEKPE